MQNKNFEPFILLYVLNDYSMLSDFYLNKTKSYVNVHGKIPSGKWVNSQVPRFFIAD